jgi:hypothetical protein
MIQALSIIGAILILAAYIAVQLRWLTAGFTFSLVNLVGSLTLTVVAVVEEQIAARGRLGAHQPGRPCQRAQTAEGSAAFGIGGRSSLFGIFVA